MSTAKLILDGKEYEFPVIVGSEGEVSFDISSLRSKSGAITLDPGYGNTGSCQSAITFIDGDLGILRYRGYPIEQLAEHSDFVEVCYLLIYGELPTHDELESFQARIKRHSLLPEHYRTMLDSYPCSAHPMAMMSAMVTSLSAHYSHENDPETVDLNIVRLLAKTKTIAAWVHKALVYDRPYVYPRQDLSYTADFLNMMFSDPTREYTISKVQEKALNLLLLLHADHEQNCSTTTVRVVGSSHSNIFASMGAGINALWGPLHGGANQEVIEMLEAIHADGGDYNKYMELAKNKDSGFRLMGFGHRVYKNFDPRARIIKQAADSVLEELGVNDPLLAIAKGLEEVALRDSYFIERKLYPNVDFYSGIIYRAMGIPTNMFTVMFALGRMPGWISQWMEMIKDPQTRIARPRQVYTGANERNYVAVEKR